MHGEDTDRAALWMALAHEFLVTEATSAFEALERLSGAPLACIICVLDGSTRADDFYALAARISLDHTRRIVFIGTAESFPAGFRSRTGCNWLVPTTQPEELLVLVRAVSATK